MNCATLGPAKGRYHIHWIALLILLTSCAKAVVSTDATVVPIVPVRSVQIVSGAVPEHLIVTGHTEALNRQKLVAPIAGRVISMLALEGGYVKAGQVVAVIQSKEAMSSEEGARIMMASAKTPAEIAEAQRMTLLAKKDQNGVEVRSHISGLIASRSTSVGEYVTESQELLSIIDEGEIDFVADVPLYKLSRLRIGQSATVNLPTLPDAELAATVIAIKPQADSSSQTAKVALHFRAIPATLVKALRTGISGSAEITVDLVNKALLVPKQAVLRNDETNTYTVVTYGPDSLAKNVQVEIGLSTDSLIEIRSNDIAAGANIITEGNYALPDSTRITINRSTAH